MHLVGYLYEDLGIILKSLRGLRQRYVSTNPPNVS
jgi:hypothetical protein